MQTSNPLGNRAERIAVKYLKHQFWTILEQNFYCGPHEIDIIARSGSTLIFVEVKARSSSTFGYPEHMITPRQIRSIQTAAEEYIFAENWPGQIRFDVISIEWREMSYRLWHIEDAF
jgi:putative endonuclease